MEHLENKIIKCNKIIGSIKKLFLILLKTCLLTIYINSVRPHLDHADIIHDKPENESFKESLEKIQYSVALAITGVIRRNSRGPIYSEFGSESLADRR